MTAFGLPMWICLAYLFVLGTVVGSFLNVCIYRIPTQERFWASLYAIVFPPSRCPRCQNRIPAWANIPVFGWIGLRGRCYHCKGWISPRYPLIEFANGALWALVYWIEVPGGYGGNLIDSGIAGPMGPHAYADTMWLSPAVMLHVRFFFHLVLLEALLVASFIDFDLMIIPDGSTLPAMTVGLLASLIVGHLYLTPVWHQDIRAAREITHWLNQFKPGLADYLLIKDTVPHWIRSSPHLHGLAVSLAGILVGGGVVWGLRILGEWALKREAMGFGDVILMALIGSFLGWQATIMVFFIAPAVALVVVVVTWLFRRRREIPFGPYLSIAALIVLLAWKPLWNHFSPVFGLGPLLLVIAVVMAVSFAIIMRGVRITLNLFGFSSLYEDDCEGEWTSGDHLFHYSSESVDPLHGRWPNHQWPGSESSRGQGHYNNWRHGPR